ncbi:MAG TPA: aminoacetone oxidase family FAD-binding enzyme [Vicinamibacteria bacterium]|nr:aminoacetone oxidase family FAD-binding enzyme [Vicinamibacteria bacterium]
MAESAGVLVVGAGAAGLMAAITAARAGAPVAMVDGARTLGAKILVSGGGRCNVTHDHVDEDAFAGSTPPAIRRVLRRFSVEDAVAFFAEQGVRLKREETGKLFPVGDRARTVLDALLAAAGKAGVRLRHPWRVVAVDRTHSGFAARSESGERLEADRVVIATGGRSLPRTGSDGLGYELVRRLGHTITPRVIPALVPLTLPRDHPLCSLPGLSAEARVSVLSANGRRRATFEGSLLCAHFGLSGPVVLDVSRHYTLARLDDPGTRLSIDWLPTVGEAAVEEGLRAAGPKGPSRVLERWIPDRLARVLCGLAGVDPAQPGHRLTREERRSLVRAAKALEVTVTGDRGFNFAEVTAGGVPLAELRLHTLESRVCPGLHLCGEICDVDGRIGGYNFQWAWASGSVAGTGAATGLSA